MKTGKSTEGKKLIVPSRHHHMEINAEADSNIYRVCHSSMAYLWSTTSCLCNVHTIRDDKILKTSVADTLSNYESNLLINSLEFPHLQ